MQFMFKKFDSPGKLMRLHTIQSPGQGSMWLNLLNQAQIRDFVCDVADEAYSNFESCRRPTWQGRRLGCSK